MWKNFAMTDFGAVAKPKNDLPIVVMNGRSVIREEFGKKLAEYLNLNISSGPWLAGGAVRKSYIGLPVGGADWDIWFRSAEQYDRAEKLMHGLNAEVAWASNNAITFHYHYEGVKHNIQLIKRRFFQSAQEVIDQFDFTVCQLITDGDQLILGPYTAHDLENRTLRSAQLAPQSYIISRMIKYMVYGYYPCRDLVDLIDQHQTAIDWKKNTHDYDAT